MPSSFRLPAVVALAGALASACASPTTPTTDGATDLGRDAADVSDRADASDTGDASDSAPEDTGPPPPRGSTEALLREVCAGRPRTGPAATISYYTGMPAGGLRSAAAGDAEAIRLTLTEPFRIRHVRVYLRGSGMARARIRLTQDIGRSIPDIDTDLMPPVEVDVPATDWVDVPVEPPVDVHPAFHPWIMVEHVTEPVSLMVANKVDMDGQQARSRARIALILNDPAMNPQRDPWLGLGTTREFMAEAVGERICTRQEAPYFTDISARVAPMLAAGRPQWVDVDSDGWEDLIAFRDGRTPMARAMVFHNRHDGTLEDVTARIGLADRLVSTATWGDLDGDGDLDLYAADYQDGTGPFPPERGSRTLLQGSDGRFTVVDAPLETPGPTDAHAMGDCDGDGRLDLFVGQWLRTYPTFPGASTFFHGLGNGRFEDVTRTAGLVVATGLTPRGIAPAFSAMWADYDNDGDSDLFVTNYLGMPNNAYVNDGACHFTDQRRQSQFAGTPPTYGTSFGIDFSDFDNDGDLDAFEANIAHARGDLVMIDHSRLLQNSGAPDFIFENVTTALGILHNEGDHEGMFGDWDNDGDLDLLVSVGPAYGYQWWRLYRQESDHFFTDVTYLAGMPNVWSGGVMFHDYDRDGDLDLVAGSATLMFLRNDVRNANHWIELRLHDNGNPNRDVIGARITVTSADGTHRLREVTAGRGFVSGQGPLTQHIGLGPSATAVSIDVRWPRGNPSATEDITHYTNVAPDRVYRIERGAAPAVAP